VTAFFHIGLALLVAFLVAGVLIPAIDGPAHRLGLIDHPDHRKRHAKPTPLTGGLGVFAGFVVAMFVMGAPMAPYWSLIIGMIVLLLTGLADDLVEVSAKARLLIQIGVGCLMVYGGGLSVNILGEIFGPAYGLVGLGYFAGPFTVACVVFMINAINMSDGLDGLAGGSCMFIFALLALAGWLSGASATLVAIPLVLALATLGFLVHNLRMPGRDRARAFLGDAGSMMLGFAIAWLAVAIHKDPGTNIYPVSIAWIMVVPAMDTLALFFRHGYAGAVLPPHPPGQEPVRAGSDPPAPYIPALRLRRGHHGAPDSPAGGGHRPVRHPGLAIRLAGVADVRRRRRDIARISAVSGQRTPGLALASAAGEGTQCFADDGVGLASGLGFRV